MTIKLIIFDLDGVIVDSRPLHYKALNRALESIHPKYIISEQEHLSTFDGLPSSVKLKMLTDSKGLNPALHETVWKRKQEYTESVIKDTIKPNLELMKMLDSLVLSGYRLMVASNSIAKTCRLMLEQLEIINCFEAIYSNEDVQKPKPHPEIYIRAVLDAGLNPKEVMICEDSPVGRRAALDSGCFLCPVSEPKELTLELIQTHLKYFNQHQKPESLPWIMTPQMTVLLPCAGAGSRFKEVGYKNIKPLIDVNGRFMIEWVINNLNIAARHIFLCQEQHVKENRLDLILPLLTRHTGHPCEIVTVPGLTEGACSTTLYAEHLIDNDQPLLIANSDQYVEWDSHAFLYKMQSEGIDAGIVTFTVQGNDPKWSFAKLDENGYVTEVQEKKQISQLGTVGYYWWKKGSDYVKYAKQMIAKNIRTNNEFYVCPVFNECIGDGKKVITFDAEHLYGLGTPVDLEESKKYLEKFIF